MSSILPGFMLIIGALAVPLLPYRWRQIWMLLLISASGWQCWQLAPAQYMTLNFGALTLIPMRAVAITKVLAVAFHIAAALNVLYAMPEKNRLSEASGLAYAGAAIAALYAGDFITLFIYWELTAFASVLLILAGQSPRAVPAAMRYLLMQVSSGVMLLGGAVWLWHNSANGADGGGLAIGALDPSNPAAMLILIAFGIKAGFPLLNGWMQDAYPEASISGTVMLSAFTTKLAIYMLAICFAGYEVLIYIGLVMIIWPIFSALLENDMRRTLTYALNNLLGFMVIGIGIGSELAINGAIAHAFASIFYQALLFMCVGAVMWRTNTAKASALSQMGGQMGGLWRDMPVTAGFCLVGAASISSLPLFSGFVSKSLIIGSAAQADYFWVWVAMLFASVGVFLHSGIKVPYLIFFAKAAGKIGAGDAADHKAKEAPLPMLAAMAISAGLCLAIGIAPNLLYQYLPYAVDYHAWSISHVLDELQLLIFAALGAGLWLWRKYPLATDIIVLNSDWLYRRFAKQAMVSVCYPPLRLWHFCMAQFYKALLATFKFLEQRARRNGLVSGVTSTGAAAGIFLAVFALILLFQLI